MRRRVIYDLHQHDVEERLIRAIGTTRATALRIVDLSSNPARYVYSQLAGLYREIPEVAPPAGAEETAAALMEAGWWQLAQRVQRDALALNDVFVRVDLDEATGEPAFRLVPPDLVSVVSSPLRPAQPLALAEWIVDPDDPARWVQLRTDPRVRLYGAYDQEGHDVSDRVLGGSFSGDAYPWVVGGSPVLPYVAYHAAETGYGLDPYTGRDAFEASLQLGVYYSLGGHALRQASWAQRWVLGAEPVGGDVDESGRRRDSIQDPATAAVFRVSEEGGTPQVGQWAAPVDVEAFFAVLERYERRVVEAALSTVGVSRRESDVRSAMSLVVSRDSQRDAQKAYEPVFRRSDLRLLRLVSGLMGAPTEGWRISYSAVQQDPAQMAAETQQIQSLVALGLLSKVAAYIRMHPGMETDEAEAALVEIARVNALYGGTALTPAPTPIQ